MEISKALTREQFLKFTEFYQVPEFVNRDFIYEIYENVINGIEELNKESKYVIEGSINHLEIINYIVGEYAYSVANLNNEDKAKFDANEHVQESMINVVADKYITLSKFLHNEGKLINKYIPPVSSLALYVNFILTILESYKQKDPKSTIIVDLLKKASSIAKCSLELLVQGFETEAFSCWRTLHECECTLILLAKYGDALVDKYIKHMNFGIAFRDIMPDKDKQTEIFTSMKEEMKEYNLKSKDIKKYIEYGWAYGIPGVKEDETFKLNFRDGIEKLAGLSSYSKRYEMSSEIIHGTPMLIYSNKTYFYYATLLSLYESFFRLEKIFVSLFVPRVNEEVVQRYATMRNLYYQQLVAIHQREAKMFEIWKKSKSKTIE